MNPPDPSWGGDLADIYVNFTEAPFATVIPGVVIVVAAFSLSRIGDASAPYSTWGERRGTRIGRRPLDGS